MTQTTSIAEIGARSRKLLLGLALLLACLLLVPGRAAAQSAEPTWVITDQAAPSYFAPGTTDAYYMITVTNDSGTLSDGSPITVTDQLPAGVTATAISGGGGGEGVSGGGFPSTGVSCVLATLTCTTTGDPSDTYMQVQIQVSVSASASGSLTDTATVSGGGGPEASTTTSTPVSTAPVPYGVSYVQTRVSDEQGSAESQAGSHPYEFTTAFGFNISSLEGDAKTTDARDFPYGGSPLGPAVAKDVDVALPPGLIGDVNAVPQCTQAQFLGSPGAYNCPADTQIGVAQVFFYGTHTATQQAAIYNIAPAAGQPAELGITIATFVHVPILFKVRTGSDYGLTAEVENMPEGDPVQAVAMTIWGEPADSGHTPDRGQPGSPGHPVSSAPDNAFLSYPTECAGEDLPVTMTSDSWQDQGVFSTASSSLPAATGCDLLSFSPSLSLTPDTSQAGAPTGPLVDLAVPQSDDPSELQTPELDDATVTLPQGMVINPSSADGLQGCSDADIALSSDQAGSCPDASEIGTVQVSSPLLPGPLTGQVYLGSPQCSPCSNQDAEDGSMVRLFIQAQGYGVVVKLAGSVSVDPSTGQLTATFDQNPQLPFSDLVLQFKTGPRAPLTNPTSCGTYTTSSELSPWSAPFTPAVAVSSSFTITGCGSSGSSQTGFAPTFSAGSVNTQAGRFSPFTLTLSRTDSDQDLSGLSVKLPDGVLAKLAGVPLCSGTDAIAGTCPADTQVGSATVAAGAGSEPVWLPQAGAAKPAVYLTGPYKGAPYGLAVVVPAIAGPFNLGTVVVRQALYVNSVTAQVTDVSDPFPTILDGIPLQIRTINVDLNRPDFTLNPTSCTASSVDGTVTSTAGTTADVSSHFQVGGCAALAFSPKLKLALSGKGQTRSGDHPTLTATLTQPSGQANLAMTSVALPLSMALDPNNSQHVCSYSVAQAVTTGPADCPASTLIGHATAVTPLLSEPLSGPVYLVQGIRYSHGIRIRTLPTLLIPLRGQIALDLRAKTSVNGKEQLVTTFSTIPDAAVSKFTLTINGGKKGILVITGRGRTICKAPQVANTTLGAQSGKTENANVTMPTPCAKVKHTSRKRRDKRVRHTR